MGESSAKSALEAIEARQAKIEAELSKLKKEQAQHRQEYTKELVTQAGALAEDLFSDLFRGAWAEKFQRLRELSLEILRQDPQSHSKLTGTDLYGLDNDAVKFYGKFCFVPLTNGKPLTDVLSRCEKHPENPFLKKEAK